MSVLCVPSFLASFDSVEAVAKNFVVRIRYWVVLNSGEGKVIPGYKIFYLCQKVSANLWI